MRDDFRQYGVLDALTAYGLTKSAGMAQMIGRSALHNVRGLRRIQPGRVLSGVKQQIIGEPRKATQQLREGTLHKPGGLLHDSFVPKSKAEALLNYGLPALSIYQATQASPDNQGSAFGSALGMGVGGMLGQPWGMAGNLAGSVLVGGLGQTMGSAFDKKPPSPQIDPSNYPNKVVMP